MYTIQKCSKDSKFYGSIHGSNDAYITICGKEIDETFYILTNNYDDEITCKKCLKILKKNYEKY